MSTPTSIATRGWMPGTTSSLGTRGLQTPGPSDTPSVRPEALTTLMETFEFSEEVRSSVTFVGSIRLDPKRHVVELLADEDGVYPTTGTHYIIGPTFNPQSVRRWIGFQAMIRHVIDIDPITGEGFRLNDGTNQWWWNGTAWELSTSQWSTEAEIADHIADFPATTKVLGVVVRLSTTDRRYTPSLSWVKVAYTARITSYMEDLLFRSLAPYLRQIRSTADMAFKQRTAGFTTPVGANLDLVGIPFNVVDVEAIYNHNIDSDHDEQLLVSYDVGTRVATLSTSVPVGNTVFARIVTAPEVAVAPTSGDYIEVDKVPSIAITDVNEERSSPLSQDDCVTNKRTGITVKIRAPYRLNVRFTMIVSAPSAVDLRRMIDDIVAHMQRNPFVYSAAMGKPYRIWMVDEFTSRSKPNNADLHTATSTFLINDVLEFTRPAVIERAVTNLHFRQQ